MNQMQFDAAIKEIVSAKKTAGYDPYMQLKGYVVSREITYITRQGGARDKVSQLDVEMIKDFLKAHNID